MHFDIFICIVFDKCLQAFQNHPPDPQIHKSPSNINFRISYLFGKQCLENIDHLTQLEQHLQLNKNTTNTLLCLESSLRSFCFSLLLDSPNLFFFYLIFL